MHSISIIRWRQDLFDPRLVQRFGIHATFHQTSSPEARDTAIAAAKGLLGHDLRDMEPRNRGKGIRSFNRNFEPTRTFNPLLTSML